MQFVLILRKNVQKRAQMYSILVQIFREICTKSEYFARNGRIFVHAEFLSTKILNLSANYLNNSLCVGTSEPFLSKDEISNAYPRFDFAPVTSSSLTHLWLSQGLLNHLHWGRKRFFECTRRS